MRVAMVPVQPGYRRDGEDGAAEEEHVETGGVAGALWGGGDSWGPGGGGRWGGWLGWV